MILELNLKNIDLVNNLNLKEKVKKELHHNPFGKYLIYIEEKKVLGYLYYSDIYERAEINQIEVENNYRNHGIGTKLMKYLIDNLKKPITLEVRIDNLAARKLYKKFNFQEKAMRSGYYRGKDGILMERK